MTKNDVVIIHTKKDKTKIRGYLLKRNTDFLPFVVCSNFRELEDGRITWDWGHYNEDIIQALIVMYEDELGLDFNQSIEVCNQLRDKIATDEVVTIVNKLNEFIA